MTDKQIIEQRPICLYQDTCLHLKEKTRVCEDCVHHKNYWSELLAKDQAEKIKNLEQECEELKKIIDEAKNSKLDLKSFLVSEAIQNEYEQQLDQLKAEIKDLKKCYKNNSALLDFEETNTTKLVNKVMKLEQTLTEIKEIAIDNVYYLDCDYRWILEQILQKISEVLND